MGRKKLWGRSSRPLCRCLLQVLSAFCCFSSLLSFWLPWIYSPFPFFMEFRNAVLLQLVECIESTQNEVKRKMIEAWACNVAPKSPEVLAREKNRRDIANALTFSSVASLSAPQISKMMRAAWFLRGDWRARFQKPSSKLISKTMRSSSCSA